MKQPTRKLTETLFGFLEKHMIVAGALVIYGYYLVLTLDLFHHQEKKTELLSLFLQFDSLLLMWGVIFVFVQLQKIRKERKEGEHQQRTLLHHFQEQQLQLDSLDDISGMLNDRINNPLSVISMSAGSLRGKSLRGGTLDEEVEKIEGALKRVQEVMMGIEAYHTKKILKLSRHMLQDEDPAPQLNA